MLINFIIGFVFSCAIAAIAYQRGSLSSSGVVGAIITGTLIFSIGGLTWGALLITFFVTSSALSHYKELSKESLAEKFQKGNRRDIWQTLANGGWGAAIAVAYAFHPHPILFTAFVGAIATVNADTWATELGVLSKKQPRLITNGRIVDVGTSGGITLFGTFAASCGSLLIGSIAFSFSLMEGSVFYNLKFIPSMYLIPIGTLSGLLGSLFDSLLGATVQAIYYCDLDQKVTESAVHNCGHKTSLIRGWRWLDNDLVNFIASVFGSLAAAGMYWLLVM